MEILIQFIESVPTDYTLYKWRAGSLDQYNFVSGCTLMLKETCKPKNAWISSKLVLYHCVQFALYALLCIVVCFHHNFCKCLFLPKKAERVHLAISGNNIAFCSNSRCERHKIHWSFVLTPFNCKHFSYPLSDWWKSSSNEQKTIKLVSIGLNLQWRTKILGTVVENLQSKSFNFQIFRCSTICTSLTTWIQ